LKSWVTVVSSEGLLEVVGRVEEGDGGVDRGGSQAVVESLEIVGSSVAEGRSSLSNHIEWSWVATDRRWLTDGGVQLDVFEVDTHVVGVRSVLEASVWAELGEDVVRGKWTTVERKSDGWVIVLAVYISTNDPDLVHRVVSCSLGSTSTVVFDESGLC